MIDSSDTDLLLALLASQLNPAPSNDVLLEALVTAEGDVNRAAQALRRPPKRKRSQPDLQDWLTSPRSPKAPRSPKSSVTWPETRISDKPLKSINDMLRDAPGPSKQPRLEQPPPLCLQNADAVATHTPCTMHHSVLPYDLATRLYQHMLDQSTQWSRNKWWLFDKVVESPHLTSFYVRKHDSDLDLDAAAQYWFVLSLSTYLDRPQSLHRYNGRPTDPPPEFSTVMEEACQYIEERVNEELSKRTRYPLEWAGSEWKANVAAANCYTGSKESVGFHSDQLTYLGPYPTIASLSLGEFSAVSADSDRY
jgi:hypothetical protein